MEGHGRRTYRTVVGMLLILIAVAGAFVLEGMYAGGLAGRWPSLFGTGAGPTGTATLTYIQRFTRCGDTTTSVVEMPVGELAGSLAATSALWAVVESGESSATVQQDIDGFCPEHEDFRLIALYRGSPTDKPHVCVFRGKRIDPDFIAKERRDLTEDILYPQDRDRLRTGILIAREDGDPPDVDLDEKAAAFLQGIGEGR